MAEQDGKPRQGGRGCRFDAAGGIIVDIAAADRQQGDQDSELNSTIWRVETAKPNGDYTQTITLSEYSDSIYP